MIDAPLAVAFTAGLVATFNPCGFAMLPAYLSWHLSDPASDTTPATGAADGRLARRLARSLTVGATVSVGFLVVFGATGALVTAGARNLLVDYLGWAALVVGILVAVLGVALLAGREISLGLPKTQTDTQRRGPTAMLAFGASYAVASLSCTLPVFLAVVASTFTRTGLATGTLTFLAYGTGMSLVLMTLTIALAFAKHTVISRLRAATRHVNRASGALLVIAGGYLVYYWAWNLNAEPGDTAGPVRVLDDMSTSASQWVQNLGWQPAALALGAIVATAAIVASRATRRAEPRDDDCCPPPHTNNSATTPNEPAAASTATCDTTYAQPLDSPGRLNSYGPAMTTPQTEVPTMTRDELVARLGDVTPVEALGARHFADMHLPGAVNLPASQVDQLAAQRLPDKHALLVVYCSNEICRNSGWVARKLVDLGYTNVHTYPEGKQGWHQAGLPTETSP